MPVWGLEGLRKVYTEVYSGSGLAWEDVESSSELWGVLETIAARTKSDHWVLGLPRHRWYTVHSQAGVPSATLQFINDDAWERSLREIFTAN